MLADQENPPTPYIYSASLPILLTISTTFDTPSSRLLPHLIALDDMFNSFDARLKYQAFGIHHSIIDHRWEPER